ncbi:M12 family metallo-peptidase [Cellulomonas marina]|nr:M12 family metallo-peptidase [Cellulomonas marina]
MGRVHRRGTGSPSPTGRVPLRRVVAGLAVLALTGGVAACGVDARTATGRGAAGTSGTAAPRAGTDVPAQPLTAGASSATPRRATSAGAATPPAAGPSALAAATPATSALDPSTATPSASPFGAAVASRAVGEPEGGGPPGVARAQDVRLDVAALPAPGPAADPVTNPMAGGAPGLATEGADETGPTTVTLGLLDGVTLDVALAAPTAADPSTTVWEGGLVDDPDAATVIVEREGYLAGTVTGPDGTVYALRADPDGTGRVEEVDPDARPEHDDGVRAPAEALTDAPAGDAAADAGALAVATASTATATAVTAGGAVPVADVLVGYTTAARVAAGGQGRIEAQISHAVAQTNMAFVDSGVTARLRLARAVEVPTDGAVTVATLDALRQADGWNDTLLALRDTSRADLVSLVVEGTSNGSCGIGYVAGGAGYAGLAFSVVARSCATSQYSFTHELGHNFGAAHDRGDWSGTPLADYGYDWVDRAGGWRTVMAYQNACAGCGRILRFSNPDQLYGGAPLGAPARAANAADNRLLLSLTAPTVAAYRSAVPLAVTSPATGALGTGRTTTVGWTAGATSLGGTVRVDLVAADGSVRTLATGVPASAGSWTWTPAATLPGGAGYRVRVTGTGDVPVTAESQPFVLVVCP